MTLRYHLIRPDAPGAPVEVLGAVRPIRVAQGYREVAKPVGTLSEALRVQRTLEGRAPGPQDDRNT